MGFLDWLKAPRSNVEDLGDFIWVSKAAKGAGVIRAVGESLSRSDAPTVVLVVAHFEDCLSELRQLLEASGINDSRVFVFRADDLPSVKNSLLGLDDLQLVDVIVAERHPLLDCDDALVEFARQCGYRFRISHHLSLEDPLMKVFGGDWVRTVLMRLGMKDDEAITSPIVSRRVRAAQVKMAQNVVDASVVKSAEAWFERNAR